MSTQLEDSPERQKAETLNIVIFEFTGTFLFTYGALASESRSYGIALIYFVCMILCGRFSGGHFNPVITLIQYIEGALSVKKALTYMVPQLVAGIVAPLIGMPLLGMTRGPYFEQNPSSQMFGTIVAEIVGSSIMFLFVCVQMNRQTQISQSPIVAAIFLSGIFFTTRMLTITMSNSLFNPACALGFELAYGIYLDQWDQWVNLISYLACPWLGGMLAQTFYYKVYVKTIQFKE